MDAGGAMDLQSLCVLPGKTCWVLHIDGLVLNADGSVLDALSLATKVTTRLAPFSCPHFSLTCEAGCTL